MITQITMWNNYLLSNRHILINSIILLVFCCVYAGEVQHSALLYDVGLPFCLTFSPIYHEPCNSSGSYNKDNQGNLQNTLI